MKELLKTVLKCAQHGRPLPPEVVEQLEAEVARLHAEDKDKAARKRAATRRMWSTLSKEYTHIYSVGKSSTLIATCGPRVTGTVQHCLMWGIQEDGSRWSAKIIKAASDDFVEYATR